jgi:hypothetical protein
MTLLLLAGAGAIAPASRAFASLPNLSSTDSGSVGIRLVAVPGASTGDPLASSYVVDRLAPGTGITRSVEIDNDSHSTVDVSVYPAAASIVRGTFAFAPGHSANDLSSWTSVTREVLRLKPGTEAYDALTINVPSTASSGEQYAVLWAEVSARPGSTGGVTLVNRVGVRVYLSIGPSGAPTPSFAIGPITAERSAAGNPLVVGTVRNSGQSTLDISGNLTLSKGPGGLGAGPFVVKLGAVLAPGVSERMTVQLNKELPRGPWQADLGLTSGFIHRSAEAMITFPRNVGGAHAPVAAGFPSLIIVIIVLLVLLLITALALLVSGRRIWRLRPL